MPDSDSTGKLGQGEQGYDVIGGGAGYDFFEGLWNKSMRIWLINTAEITPVDRREVRLRRSGLLAQALVEHGHELLWWSADFFHATKKHRYGRDTRVEYADRYRIKFIHGPGYRRNLSIKRLIDHRVVARRFLQLSFQEQKPDIVICSLPTLDLSLAAVKYGFANEVPVVLDIRDLWPEIFLQAVPRHLRIFGRLPLLPYYHMAKRACAQATAIVANAPAFVTWGIKKAGRRRTELDLDFPFGYQEPLLNCEEKERSHDFWLRHGVDFKSGTPIVCYFGAISHASDFAVIIEAARFVLRKHNVLFVLCGDGDKMKHCRLKTVDLPSIVLPGWVSASDLWVLMKNAHFGLTAYYDNINFRDNLPNKPIEYFAGGLPVLSSIDKGHLSDVLRNEQCGLTYGGDAKRLASIICRLIETPEERELMSINARRLYEKNFVVKKIYDAFVAHIVRIVEVYRDRKMQL